MVEYPTEPPFLTIPETALRLGLSRTRAYAWVRGGVLPAVQVNGRLLVPAGALEAWVTEQEARALASVGTRRAA